MGGAYVIGQEGTLLRLPYVMRLDGLARQIAFGDDHARTAPAETGQRLLIVLCAGVQANFWHSRNRRRSFSRWAI